MYDEWPLLALSNDRQGVLSAFTREGGQAVASLLVRELADAVDNSVVLRIENAEDLHFTLQVLSHALTLSFQTSAEYETIKGAIRVYLVWLSALTKDAHSSVPKAVRENLDSYLRSATGHFPSIFNYRQPTSMVDQSLTTERQARQIQNILSGVQWLTIHVINEYRENSIPIMLKFLLNVADKVLAGCYAPDDLAVTIGVRLVSTLFDCWLHAAIMEMIPTPSYWKTLNVLCRRWRHHVSLLEVWARKLLSLTVLLVRQEFGADYCSRSIDENVGAMFHETLKNSAPSPLTQIWLHFFCLLGTPADIMLHEPTTTPMDPVQNIPQTGSIDDSNRTAKQPIIEPINPFTAAQLPLCFFLANTAMGKMVDIFYGDCNVSIDFRESEELMKLWSDANRSIADEWTRQQQHAQARVAESGSSNSNSGGLLSKKPQSSQRSRDRHSAAISLSDAPPDVPKPRPFQFVWYNLKANRVQSLPKGPRKNAGRLPMANKMLEIFIDSMLHSIAVKTPKPPTSHDDAVSQTSQSSADIEGSNGLAATGGSSAAFDSTTRRSFAGLSTTSSDISGPLPNVDWPGCDGVAAGRAAAAAALCRVICAKSPSETIDARHLTRFYAAVHDCLVEKDRMVLCSLIYYSTNLFRIGLMGVEVLLPQFIMAIDVVLTESMKLRLHPSIPEIEMRRACLQILASIVSWPTTFGLAQIPYLARSSAANRPTATTTNDNNEKSTYLELRQRIQRNLLFSLRHETDAGNLTMALNISVIFCQESADYELSERIMSTTSPSNDDAGNAKESRTMLERKRSMEDNGNKSYCSSALRSFVSAICDNICKRWANDLGITLAALDAVNAFAQLDHSILFAKNDLSTGALIVTSLCRFVETQLMKPPPAHSRDLHSSVVAAYNSLNIWLCSASQLAETEPCLTTIAETIELGVTGGKKLSVNERKPASQRVHDAAEQLLHSLFVVVGGEGKNIQEIADESALIREIDGTLYDRAKFRYYLIGQSTIIAFYEATAIAEISKGKPSCFLITRTPFHLARTHIAQLLAKVDEEGEENHTDGNSTVTPVHRTAKLSPMVNGGDVKKTRELEIPTEFTDKPLCKLDSILPPLTMSPESDAIKKQLAAFRAQYETEDDEDLENVWNRPPLVDLVSQPVQPPKPAANCQAGRILLFDLGLISKEQHGKDLVALDSHSDLFFADLHELVDRCPAKMLQTVYLLYVKSGETEPAQILQNGMHIESTSESFCRLLANLAHGVNVNRHPFWTGNWRTAFGNNNNNFGGNTEPAEHYLLDGSTHCLWWDDGILETAFIVPTQQCLAQKRRDSDGSTHQQGSRNSPMSQSQSIDLPTAILSESDTNRTVITNGSTKTTTSSPPMRPPRTKSSSTLSSDSTGPTSAIGVATRAGKSSSSDQRVFVIWLENLDDEAAFPASELLAVSNDSVMQKNATPEVVLIFLHRFESGLVRVVISSQWSKFGAGGPLSDGLVISEEALPTALRLTVAAITRRKALDMENSQMAFVRRRHAIQEFARKYAIVQPFEQFLMDLLKP